MEFVTLVNRSSKTLKGVWDGRHYDLAPGKHSFPRIQADKFKAQNPILGTENKYTGDMLYLIGIEEDHDDCTPVEQSNAFTLADLEERIKSGELKIIQGNGLYRPAFDAGPKPFISGGPVETFFDKP